MTQRLRLRLGASAAALACLAAAGCSSGGGSGPSAATAARNQAVPAARSLYQHLFDGHIGWSGQLNGQYEHCLTTSSQNELEYHAIVYYLYPFDRSITASAYLQQLMSAVRAAGWAFKTHIPNSRDGNVSPDQMEKGSLDGHIAVSTAPSSNYSKVSGLVEIESTCFDAGSDAQSLLKHGDQFTLPKPSSTPGTS